MTDDEPQWIVHGWARVVRSHDWDAFARARSVLAPDFDPSDWRGPYRDLSRDVPRGTS